MLRAMLLVMLALPLVGCAPAVPAPTPVPTATATSAPTATVVPMPTFAPSPPPSRPQLLRTFARQIDEAVSSQDADALVALTRGTEWDCRQATEPGPICPEAALGTIRRGIRIGPWASEYDLIPVEEYRSRLADFFAQSRPTERDSYGSGAPRLFDLRCPLPGPEELEAIVTAIGPEGRVALLLRSEYRLRSWSITAVVTVGPPFIGEALAPGPSCYDIE